VREDSGPHIMPYVTPAPQWPAGCIKTTPGDGPCEKPQTGGSGTITWQSGGAEITPSLPFVSTGRGPLIVWGNSTGEVMRCDMPTDTTVKNCKIGKGRTLEEVVGVFLEGNREAWKYHEDYVQSLRVALEKIDADLRDSAPKHPKKKVAATPAPSSKSAQPKH